MLMTREIDPALPRMKKMCSVFSHNLNNYVGVLQGYIELLRLDAEPASETWEYLDRMAEGCGLITNLIKNMETFSESRRSARQQCNLADVLPGAPAVHVWGSPAQLRILFQHLIANAEESGGPHSVRVATEDPYLVIEIEDKGCGMTPEVRERAFDMFYSTKGKGRGLGLSLCHGIVGQHDGTIELESEPGRGTLVTVRLAMKATGEDA